MDVVLAELEGLLAVDDIRANTVFREAAPLLRAVLGDAVGALERQIGGFANDEALRSLREIMAKRSELRDD